MTKKNRDNPLRLIVFLCVLLMSSVSFAQSKNVTGTIKDANGVPLAGATVIQKGTQNGTSTDFDGRFNLTMTTGDEILTISYIGYITEEIDVSSRVSINVLLEEDTDSLDEVVIVGYAAVERENILGAVSTVKKEAITQTTPVDALESIQGRVAGVNISQNGGPGSGYSIQIRGVSTFNAGSSPLFVVDGQQVDNIDNLNPNIIESIEILKDGASAAIYGSQSANGVVVIQTKKGRVGKSVFSVDYTNVYSFVNSHIPVASTRQRVYYEDIRRGNSNSLTGNQRDSLSLLLRNSNDLQKLLFRPARRSQVNAAVSGGSETFNYFWNTGFVEEEGTVINSDYKRFDTQFRLNATLFERLDVGTSTYLSYDKGNGLNENQVFQQVAERIPYFPVFEPDGSFTPEIAGRQNPVAEAAERTLFDQNIRIRSRMFADLHLFPTLSARSTFSIDSRDRQRFEFNPTIVERVGRSANGRERNQWDYNFLQENILTYREDFGKHNVQAILGNSWQQWTTERTELRSREFLFDEVPYFGAVDSEDPFVLDDTFTDKARNSLIGYFGQLQYNFDKRYLFDVTLRRDGTSRTGINERFGNFKSFSVGWRPTREPFLKDVSWLNNLLLRFSYGENGNQNIGDYDNQQTYQFGFNYNGLNGVAFGPQFGNPNLKWERTFNRNFGLSMSMFDNRLNINADYYIKRTVDLLDNASLQASSGFSSVRTNVGSIENRGIELTIDATPIRTDNFVWRTSFNISTLDNEVLDVADERGFFDDGIYRIQEGESIGNMWGYKNLGVFQYDESNAFTPDGTQLTPNFDDGGNFTNYTLNGQVYDGDIEQLMARNFVLEGGDIIWEDLNGDFNITDQDDRQVIGNGLVDYFGGFANTFSYNNMTLDVFFDYNFGNDIFRNYDQRRNDLNSSNETPDPRRIDGAWVEQGDIAIYPILSRSASHRVPNSLTNSIYVDKGDYIRLRTIRLRYRLGTEVIEKIGFIDSFELSLAANNIATWTNYTGYNPDLGSRGNPLQPGLDNLRYPNKTDIILGLNIRL